MPTYLGDTFESSTFGIVATIADEAGVTLGSGVLTTLTLTLYNVETGAVVNGRNAQSILNANGGVVDGAGTLTLTLAPADTALQDSTKARERRRALLKWTWNAGAKVGFAELDFAVKNTQKVP